VPLGLCHCGVAAASGEMQFSSNVDDLHAISYPGMTQHGHYNLPLISEGEVTLDGTPMKKGDGAEVTAQKSIRITAEKEAEILVLDVPPLRGAHG
jgi:redox-sensitive bicupin YhaK (pirin superfamily)